MLSVVLDQSSNYASKMRKSFFFRTSLTFFFLLASDLTIERFCMTGGKSPIGYLKAYLTNLYLSKSADKVIQAIDEGK